MTTHKYKYIVVEDEHLIRKNLIKHKIEESLKVFQIVYKDLYL